LLDSQHSDPTAQSPAGRQLIDIQPEVDSGAPLFDIFINDPVDETKCTLSKFAGDTKPGEVADLPRWVCRHLEGP